MNKERQLIGCLRDNSMKYVQIRNSRSLTKIHNLFVKNIIDEQSKMTPLERYYFGMYFEWKGDFRKMLNYYKTAHQNCVPEASYALGMFWMPSKVTNQQDFDAFILARDYLWSAFTNGYTYACEALGDAMEHLCDKSIFKQYLEIAVTLNNPYAIRRLAFYCCNVEKDYDRMISLFSLAIRNGDTIAVQNLRDFCDDKLANMFLEFDETVLVVVLSHQFLFTREQLINCFNFVFDLFEIKNQSVYDCLSSFRFVNTDDGYEKLASLQRQLKQRK